ncbi:PREDICTED: lysozyme c-1-like [Nicrophorus vespilloides]|uniref:lysozyme n=1 Tax=Nicrophorus vespilloides TaxID=110193 RepID=A0ABM1MEM0_NICVS|nr:PREDICTED: lysozyme c-1-like [Nicrophorus vespilloides]XP_017773020.1 PREDICTED: lysozyme c-1-like [Nicrophorus vespilloides]
MIKFFFLLGLCCCCCLLVEVRSKVFSPEEFGEVMRNASGVNASHIEIWKCLVKWESSFDTAAHNTKSGDHGIFQINEKWWCSPPGKYCQVACVSLRDDDITDDIECALSVYDEHERISGNGFRAWHGYTKHCMNVTAAEEPELDLKENETI